MLTTLNNKWHDTDHRLNRYLDLINCKWFIYIPPLMQSALQTQCITFIYLFTYTHSYTDGRGNHARHQHAHREQLGLLLKTSLTPCSRPHRAKNKEPWSGTRFGLAEGLSPRPSLLWTDWLTPIIRMVFFVPHELSLLVCLLYVRWYVLFLFEQTFEDKFTLRDYKNVLLLSYILHILANSQ